MLIILRILQKNIILGTFQKKSDQNPKIMFFRKSQKFWPKSEFLTVLATMNKFRSMRSANKEGNYFLGPSILVSCSTFLAIPLFKSLVPSSSATIYDSFSYILNMKFTSFLIARNFLAGKKILFFPMLILIERINTFTGRFFAKKN